MVRRATLDGGGDDVLRFADGVLFGFRFDGFRLGCRALLDVVEERLFKLRRSLFLGHARDPFQLALHDLLRMIELFLDGFQPVAMLFDALLGFLDLGEFLVEGVLFLVEVLLLAVYGVFLLKEAVFRPLPVRSAFLGLALELCAKFVLLFFGFQKTVFSDGFCLKPGFFEDPCRFSFCHADLVLRIQSVCDQPDCRADGEGCDCNPDDRSGFECGKQ